MEKETIRQIRERLSLTQEEMARRIGVSVTTVTRWERGISKPSPLAQQKILEIKKASTGILF